jgi:DNA-binding NtrC family response regulator
MAMDQYSWPGNVRELDNMIQRAVVLSEGSVLELSNLPPALRGSTRLPDAAMGVSKKTGLLSYEEELKRFKRNLVIRTLQECGWRKAESARALGVARGYLHRLINQLDIHEPQATVDQPPNSGTLSPVM